MSQHDPEWLLWMLHEPDNFNLTMPFVNKSLSFWYAHIGQELRSQQARSLAVIILLPIETTLGDNTDVLYCHQADTPENR